MIIVHDIWKRFGRLEVLKGLDLEIEQGETLVILGRSGVGKSVLLKHIIGILKPDKGYVEVDGIRVTDLSPSQLYRAVKHMGMLFQGAALFDSMTVFENTAFYLNQHGDPNTGKRLPRSEIEDRVEEALNMVDLPDIQGKMPSELSGGMKKRAALARLVVYRPRILLYDEPTTGLDPMTAQHISELIVNVQQELEATSLVVTHDIQSALFVGDRLALHDDGHIAHIAKKSDFLKIDDPLVHGFVDSTLKGVGTPPKKKRKRRNP